LQENVQRLSRYREVGWRTFFLVFLGVLVAFLLFLGLANAFYLGWSDFVHYTLKPRMWRIFGLTVGTASLATLLAMAVAVPVGYTLSRWRFKGGGLLDALVDLPMMVPPAAIGMFLLGFFGAPPGSFIETGLGLKLAHALPGVVVAQVAVTASFGIRVVKSTFDGIDPGFEAVARSLGASFPRTFFKVSLPLARNGLLAGAIIVWARAVAEYEALMLFVGAIQGRTDVMPLAVYLDVTAGKLEWAVAISAYCVLVAVASVWALRRVAGRGVHW
jgi:molybdate transport system permease protein